MTLAGAAQAAEPEFLFDALHGKPTASWDRLMKLVQPTPDWLVRFNANFDGVAGQVKPSPSTASPTRFLRLQAEDCAGHKFAVLFDAEGVHACGALGGKDESPAFFGAPSPAEQDALAKAVKG